MFGLGFGDIFVVVFLLYLLGTIYLYWLVIQVLRTYIRKRRRD